MDKETSRYIRAILANQVALLSAVGILVANIRGKDDSVVKDLMAGAMCTIDIAEEIKSDA